MYQASVTPDTVRGGSLRPAFQELPGLARAEDDNRPTRYCSSLQAGALHPRPGQGPVLLELPLPRLRGKQRGPQGIGGEHQQWPAWLPGFLLRWWEWEQGAPQACPPPLPHSSALLSIPGTQGCSSDSQLPGAGGYSGVCHQEWGQVHPPSQLTGKGGKMPVPTREGRPLPQRASASHSFSKCG